MASVLVEVLWQLCWRWLCGCVAWCRDGGEVEHVVVRGMIYGLEVLKGWGHAVDGCGWVCQACEKRVEEDEKGHKHCTGQYFDYWGCIDKCVSDCEGMDGADVWVCE